MIRDGYVIIKGIEFEIPNRKELKPWNYKEWKEGKNKFKSVWVDSYEYSNNAYSLISYNIVSKNGSTFLFDDCKLHGDDAENAKKLFKGIESGL